MTGYLPLSFVEEKVRDLENALFFSTSDAVLKIPACVVRILEIDELGQLWFVVPKPTQFIYTFERTFPVKLNFFRKGRNYFMKILGKAFIVHDPEEINGTECLSDFIKQRARENELVILKVQITHADYAERTATGVSTRLLYSQVKMLIRQFISLSGPQSPGVFRRIPTNHRVHVPVYNN
jgi:general stress protein 26